MMNLQMIMEKGYLFGFVLILMVCNLNGSLYAQTGGDAIIYTDKYLGNKIEHFYYDVKNSADKVHSTSVANELFDMDKMNGIRVPIFGDQSHPFHPAAGQVVESGYESILKSIQFARQARGEKDFYVFASKKLDGQNSFPAWTKDANGVIPTEYIKLLTDYLLFMKDKGVEIDYLGIQNEEEYNEGNITPLKHKIIIDSLRVITARHGLKMPLIIGWEGYGPNKMNWMKTMSQNGWLDRMDIYGVHYYPQFRPWNGLISDLNYAGDMPFWATEPHWDNKADVDDWKEAEEGICTFWDQADAGMSGFMWWAYKRSGSLRGHLMREFSVPLKDATMIDMDDIDGRSTKIYGRLQTRAFRNDNTITVYAVNNNASKSYTNYGFKLNSGDIIGQVNYRQWVKGGTINGVAGAISPTTTKRFELSLPALSITSFTFSLASANGITVNAEELDFGLVDSDAGSLVENIFVTAGNIGGNISMGISGENASAFQIVGNSLIDASNTIINKPIGISFTPAGEGAYNALLTLTANNLAVEVVLKANVYSLSPIALPFVEPFPGLVSSAGPVTFVELNAMSQNKGWDIKRGSDTGTDRIHVLSSVDNEGYIKTPEIIFDGPFELKFFARMLLNNIGATNDEKNANNASRNFFAVIGADTIYNHKLSGSTLYQNYNEWTCTYAFNDIERIKFVPGVSNEGVWEGKNDGFSFGPKDVSVRVQATTLPTVNIPFGSEIYIGEISSGSTMNYSLPLKGWNLNEAITLSVSENSNIQLIKTEFEPDANKMIDEIFEFEINTSGLPEGAYTQVISLSGEANMIRTRYIRVAFDVFLHTNVDESNDLNIVVFSKNNSILINITKPIDVEVYSLTGALVARLKGDSSYRIETVRGVYLVKAGTEVKKVMVK